MFIHPLIDKPIDSPKFFDIQVKYDKLLSTSCGYRDYSSDCYYALLDANGIRYDFFYKRDKFKFDNVAKGSSISLRMLTLDYRGYIFGVYFGNKVLLDEWKEISAYNEGLKMAWPWALVFLFGFGMCLVATIQKYKFIKSGEYLKFSYLANRPVDKND